MPVRTTVSPAESAWRVPGDGERLARVEPAASEVGEYQKSVGSKVADIDTVERPNADPERLFGFQTEDSFAV